ncbi:hypothetical protein GCM10010210_09090 [Pseudonocardia hydrocarbonoxydans]|uniref:Uncharacterized protein n=2 Tax=Pseudonocardia hydrocarbonoxydans TaxID=76726 RepID=A0A4Y3WMX0_9PSEU|nr:hypothetical protein PHY01_21210 [Pseudonocardia hydrocarbonoxydans]
MDPHVRPAVVVPVDGRPVHPAANPWESLARGEGMLVSWSDGPVPAERSWGAPLRASSALGRQLADIAARTGSSAQASRIFRMELPVGYGVDDLVRTVGGGVSSAVRGAGGRIVGQARLVPMSPARMAAGLNPAALGLMAVLVVAEMAGGDEQERRLDAIRDGVDRLNARFDMDDDARLHTAEQAIRQSHAALLDGATIPESIGLGTAMSNLQVIRHRSVTLLTGWERVVAGLGPADVSGSTVREALGAVGSLGWDSFPSAVRTAYLSLNLDARRIMLTTAEAQLRNPGMALAAFREGVEADLAVRRAELRRLRALFVRLSTVPLGTSGWALPNVVADSAAENARTQVLFATLATALSSGDTPAHPAVVEAELRSDGTVQLLRPAQ